MNATSKKAQMEILGLAIVVVLLILGMVFVVRVLAEKKPSTIQDDVEKSELATGFLSTYLATGASDCNGLAVSELLQDCAARGGISCPSSQGPISSCDKAEEIASLIFSRSFDIWKQRYGLTASLPKQEPLLKLGRGCTGERQSETFPLPSRAGTIQIKIDIC